MITESLEILADGGRVCQWDLRNDAGAGATVMELGATQVSVTVPDRAGQSQDVTLDHDRIAD